MYMPTTEPSRAARVISITVSPRVGESERPQARSNFSRIASSSTDW
jgi:hypothetical protein